MFGRRKAAEVESREDRARNILVSEILRLDQMARGKPYIATLMLDNIVQRYYKNMGWQ